MTYLKAVFPSPPACVFFGRHVYDRHNVPHLDHKCVMMRIKSHHSWAHWKLHYDGIRTTHAKTSTEFAEGWKNDRFKMRLFSSFVLYNRVHLKGQLVCGLGCVTFGDMCSSDGRDVDWGFLRHQQMVPLVVDLEKKIMTLATTWHLMKYISAILSIARHVGQA